MDPDIIRFSIMLMLAGALGAIGLMWGLIKYFDDREAQANLERKKNSLSTKELDDGSTIFYIDDEEVARVFPSGQYYIGESIIIQVAHFVNQKVVVISNVFLNNQSVTAFLSEDKGTHEIEFYTEVFEELKDNGSITSEEYDEAVSIMNGIDDFSHKLFTGKIVYNKEEDTFTYKV